MFGERIVGRDVPERAGEPVLRVAFLLVAGTIFSIIGAAVGPTGGLCGGSLPWVLDLCVFPRVGRGCLGVFLLFACSKGLGGTMLSWTNLICCLFEF